MTTRLRLLARAGSRPPGDGGADARERCELCAADLAPGHRHLFDVRAGEIRCACPACSVLFDHADGSGTPYRLLPAGARRLEGCAVGDPAWAGLGVPVSLAFFTRSAASGEVGAAYPSPLGLMRSRVDPAAWSRVAAAHPELPTMAGDVEAFLVHRDRGDGREARYWIAPLDHCYRLAALVRAHWKGLGGGPEVWRRIDGFFDALSAGTPPDTQEASWASP